MIGNCIISIALSSVTISFEIASENRWAKLLPTSLRTTDHISRQRPLTTYGKLLKRSSATDDELLIMRRGVMKMTIELLTQLRKKVTSSVSSMLRFQTELRKGKISSKRLSL